MAAFASNYLVNKLLDDLMRATAYSPPSSKYLALYTSAPTATGGGVEVPSGVGYSRVLITSNLTNWSGTQGAGSTTVSAGDTGVISNNNIITFGAPTGDWGTITHWGILDASTGGNLLLAGSLTTPVSVVNGGLAPTIPAGALQIGIYPVE